MSPLQSGKKTQSFGNKGHRGIDIGFGGIEGPCLHAVDEGTAEYEFIIMKGEDGKYYYDSFGKNVKLTFTLDGEKEKKAVAIYAHMASLPYEIERELINQIEKHNLENPKMPPIIYSDIGESCWDSNKKERRKPVGEPEIFKVSNIEVSKGDVLGYGGNTGYSIGSHLHFELHVENESENSVDKEPDMKLVNPDDYIKFPWES